MRYIADANGYLKEVSFGATIECNDTGCTEYTGGVPSGYDSLVEWFVAEADKLYRWKIVNGELTLDSTATAPADAKETKYLKTYYAVSQLGLTGKPTTDEVFAAMPNRSILVQDNNSGLDNNIGDTPNQYMQVVLYKGYRYGSGIATKINSTLKENYQFDWYNGGSYNGWTQVGDVVMRKIWENGKPTSSYPATTETPTGYGGYEAALVCARLSTSTAAELPPVLIRKGGNAANIYGVSSGCFARRAVSFTDSGIIFEKAGKIASYSGTFSSNDALIIPTIIYGVKGVN